LVIQCRATVGFGVEAADGGTKVAARDSNLAVGGTWSFRGAEV
jgi:hypothetical protein